jgi:hypothetical protein
MRRGTITTFERVELELSGECKLIYNQNRKNREGKEKERVIGIKDDTASFLITDNQPCVQIVLFS